MPNTKYNSAGILVFDSETQSRITGDEDYSEFDAMFGIESDSTTSDVVIDDDLLPTINVGDIESVAQSQFNTILPHAEKLAKFIVPDNYLEIIEIIVAKSKPDIWCRVTWTGKVTYVKEIPPSEKAIVFDVETYVTTGNYPILGQALSTKAIYCWLHPSWNPDLSDLEYSNELVSIGNHPRSMIAHNSAFDAARVAERFQMHCPIRTIDTMSMVNCLSSLDSSSRWATMVAPGSNPRADKLRRLGCAKSLIGSYNFWCGADYPHLHAPDKKARNIFVKATDFSEFIENREQLLTYSMLDVIYTHRLYSALYKPMIDWSNGYSILVGQAEVANSLLPSMDNREDWIAECDDLLDQNMTTILEIVKDSFTELHDAWLAGTLDESSIKADWRINKPKGYRKKVLPEGWSVQARWFKAFIDGDLGVTTLDFSRLLQLEYFVDGKWRRLQQHRSWGWFYIKNGCETRMPHPNGSDANVGNILTSDSLKFFDDHDEPILRSKTLENDSSKLLEILELMDSVTTFRAFRERVVSQFVSRYDP